MRTLYILHNKKSGRLYVGVAFQHVHNTLRAHQNGVFKLTKGLNQDKWHLVRYWEFKENQDAFRYERVLIKWVEHAKINHETVYEFTFIEDQLDSLRRQKILKELNKC